MTLYDDDRYEWRETYYVYFESNHRPKLAEVRRALKIHAPFLEILDIKAEPTGEISSLTIASYENHAALEIVYREGNDVMTEAKVLAHTLKETATPREHLQLKKIFQCRERLDVLHFEQTADTRAFNVTKVPEIEYPKSGTLPTDPGAVFMKALASHSKARQHPDDLHAQVDEIADCSEMDTVYERINPEMLVTVLGILCRTCQGVAIDPASGIILE